jgi:arsenate reductase-like glutaredoxin family protein
MGVATLYGIRNCDTVKKARAWLEEHRVDYKPDLYKSIQWS